MNASIDVLTLFLFNIVLVNIPLLYGTVGEIVTEKAGSLNLGVEPPPCADCCLPCSPSPSRPTRTSPA